MRLKLQNSSIILFVLVGLAFYSCVDEPDIEPVKTPYTSVRVANFSNNQATLNITVDGEFVENLAQNSLTTYFDLVSGSRVYSLKDANGNEFFSKPITMVSYEEMTLVFSGYSSTVDTLNTFGFQTFTDGRVYLNDTEPEPSTTWLRFFHFISDQPTELKKKMEIEGVSADTTFIISEVDYGDKVGVNVPAGEYTISYFPLIGDNLDRDSTTMVTQINQFGSQKRYYNYIYGEPSAFQVQVEEQEILPVRSK